MATFSKIDGAEPSTVTFRLATVTQDRGGQTQHQEIVTLGGSESTLAIAQVRAAAPASTDFGVVVRIAGGPSSVVDLAVRAVLPSTATDNPVSAAQAGTWNIGTVTSVSSLSTGHVTVDTGSIRVHQSTAADLNVTVAGYSTTVNVSSLAGTVVVAGNQSSNSSVYLPVRLTNGTAFLTASQDFADGSTASGLSGPAVMFDNGTNVTMRAVSLTLGLPVNVVAGTTNSVLPNSSVATRWFPVQISDGSTWISDSTNRAIRVNVVAGSAAGDTTVSVTPNSSGATRWFPVQVSDGSTWISDSTNRAIRVNVVAGSVAGDTTATVSFAAGYVSTAAPAANSSGLIVRVVDYSTTVNISSLAGPVITRSSAANMLVTAYQSSAADLNVTVAGYSTTVNISSLAGPVIVRSSAANALVSVYQSTAADLNVTVAGYSTTVNVSSGVIRAQNYTSSGGAIEGSTASPAQGVIGLHVREALSSLQSTTVLITSTASTAIYTLVSSAAGVSYKVYAFSVTSTHTRPSTFIFASSNAGDCWGVGIGSGSSGMTGANLAIPPIGGAFLFRTAQANALTCRFEEASSAASTQVARVSISWITEP